MKQKTLKVSDETYNRVRELADSGAESIGAVAEALLSDALRDFKGSVRKLIAHDARETAPNSIEAAPSDAPRGARKGAKGRVVNQHLEPDDSGASAALLGFSVVALLGYWRWQQAQAQRPRVNRAVM